MGFTTTPLESQTKALSANLKILGHDWIKELCDVDLARSIGIDVIDKPQ